MYAPSRRFSSTVIRGKTFRPWGTYVMPRRRRSAGRPVGDVLAGEADATLAGGQEPEDRLEHGGLAGSVGADDRDDLPGLDPEGHAAEDLHLPVAGVDVLDLEQGHALPPEVRVQHQRIVGDLGRRALGDALALAQDDDAPAERHDDFHVVLDDDEGVALGVERVDVADELL